MLYDWFSPGHSPKWANNRTGPDLKALGVMSCMSRIGYLLWDWGMLYDQDQRVLYEWGWHGLYEWDEASRYSLLLKVEYWIY
jgi:hypothetical protein